MATVVIEAGVRSGSLNTAAHAASLGRPLGAVPGPVTSASSAGCHRLLREFNAECVTTPDEVVALFTPAGASPAASPAGAGDTSVAGARPRHSGETLRLLDALSSRSARRTDDVAKRAGLGLDRTRAMLGVLQLAGEVTEVDLGWKKIEP